MDTAKVLLQMGRLSEAIEALNREVRLYPALLSLRTFLFELLCFKRDWSRAEKQLDVIGHVGTEIGVQVYRNILRAEREREAVFREGRKPYFFLEPPPYIDRQLQLIHRAKQLASNADVEQQWLQIESMWPQLRGQVNDQHFEDWRDCHNFLGPVLEVIVRDQYAWLPFEHIKLLEKEEPQTLRDSLWSPARIEIVGGTIAQAFIPCLYLDGEKDVVEDRLLLGRMTDWQNIDGRVFRARGLRMFLSDSEEYSIHVIRSLAMSNAANSDAPYLTETTSNG